MADKNHRSFTIRVPIARYLQMSDMAQKEGLHLNQKVNQILALGLGEQIKLDSLIARMIKTTISDKAPETND